jgi:hypothetical protein
MMATLVLKSKNGKVTVMYINAVKNIPHRKWYSEK